MASESEICVDELLLKVKEANDIQTRLDIKSTPELIDQAKILVGETQTFIDNNKSIIPSFILKQSSEALRNLEKHINNCSKSKLIFKFKVKECHVTKPVHSIAASETNQPDKIHEEAKLPRSIFGFQNLKNQNLIMNPDQVQAKDVCLSDLEDCNVIIRGLANTVYIRNLKNTSVLICLACRAVTVKDCNTCRLNLICQQLRIDSTVDCEFNIFTSARSMLESSKGIIFSELNLDSLDENGLSKEQVQQLMSDAKFNAKQNNWRCVDDFDWLTPDKSSDNYKLL